MGMSYSFAHGNVVFESSHTHDYLQLSLCLCLIVTLSILKTNIAKDINLFKPIK